MPSVRITEDNPALATPRRSTPAIARDIATFAPGSGSWLRLDSLLAELWAAGTPEQAIPELFSVFERYPQDDGFGVAWAVLHGLESLPGYKDELLRSLKREPSEFGVLMVGRLVNGGVTEIGAISIQDLLRDLADTAVSKAIRETAQLFVSRAS